MSKPEHDDLDFHVEFPSPNIQEGQQLIWPKEKADEKEIMVILLGWAGAEDKYLAKYSDIYHKRGCVVLRYTVPIRVLFLESEKLPILASRLIDFIKDLQLDSHPIFFHVFSNGGTFIYSNILKELQRENVNLDIRGSIFDSAPAPRNLVVCYRALANIFGRFSHLRWIMAGCVVFLLVIKVAAFYVKCCFCPSCWEKNFSSIGKGSRRSHIHSDPPLHNWLTRIIGMKNHTFLFIYSDADELIPDKKVEDFAESARENGNEIKLMKFYGSPHVQHYRKYPEDYVFAVKDFIKTTMKENRGATILSDE